jgi:hypothetical protein
MKVRIINKKDFVSNFLGSISNVNESCVLKVSQNSIETLLASADSTLVVHGKTAAVADGTKQINIPDVKKFVRVLDCVNISDETPLEFNVTNNCIKYTSSEYKFSYHLLEDGIIKSPSLNIDRVNELKFDTTFNITENELNNLFKGSSFTTNTNKLYIFCENNCIFGELGDKTRHNTDNFQCVLSKTYTGQPLSKSIPINFDTFRLINYNKCKELQVSVSMSFGVLKVSITKGDTNLIYVISALIN